jgi:hypothetical protein
MPTTGELSVLADKPFARHYIFGFFRVVMHERASLSHGGEKEVHNMCDGGGRNRLHYH